MSLKVSLLWIVAGLAVHFTFAFLAGARWERGQAAQRERAALSHELDETRAAARQLRAMALTVQAEHLASVERLNAIASDFEVSRDQQQTHFIRQRTALAALLEARPDLAARVGPDVLRHWRASNAGGDGADVSDPAAAAASGGADAAVPAPAAAGRGHLDGLAGEPRCGHGAVSPLPGAALAPDRSGEGVGAHGAADVLCGAERHGTAGGDVR